MKRKNNLYKEIVSFSKALEIFDVIKNNYQRKENLYKFVKYKNCYLLKIVNALKNESFTFDKYRIFLIKDPKYRIIMAESLPDKIVNHLVCRYILLLVIEPSLVDTNVATREGRGSGYAFDKLIKYFNSFNLEEEVYVLKVDISKYFYNIDHDLLMKMVERKIKDKKALKIIRDIIDTTNMEYVNKDINNLRYKEIERIKGLNISLKEKEKKIRDLMKIPVYQYGKGLPIGNMTSQTLAIFYLNEVDYYIKEVLKFKCYIRYMDDLLIIDSDKERLKDAYFKIVKKINEYKLEVNDKSNLYRLSKGINFLGYNFKINKGKILIRYNNMTIRRINKNLKKNKENDFELYLKSKHSYKGYFLRCNTNLYIDKYMKYDSNSLFDKYDEIKDNFRDYIVFVKYKKKYYTFDNDVGKLFGLSFNEVVKIRSDDIKNVWKVMDEYNIKYIVYAGNDFRKFNDGGNVLEMMEGKRIVFRKNGNFYRCYDDDALIVAYLFDYRIVSGSVGFPQVTMEKIKRKLEQCEIDYVFKDNMQEMCEKSFEDNQYDVYVEKGRDRYRKLCLIDDISKKLLTLNEDKINEIRDIIDKME